MLAAFFGPASAGYFALSRRVLALPSALVSQSVGTVLLPRLAERARRGETLQPTLVKATLGLAGAGLLPFAVVVLFGPALFVAAFGAGWEVAGEYARWLALWLYFNFVNAPCVQAVSVLGLQRQFLVYETVSTCARVSGLALGARLLGDALGAVTLFSVAGALLYTVLIVWVLTSSGRSVRK